MTIKFSASLSDVAGASQCLLKLPAAVWQRNGGFIPAALSETVKGSWDPRCEWLGKSGHPRCDAGSHGQRFARCGENERQFRLWDAILTRGIAFGDVHGAAACGSLQHWLRGQHLSAPGWCRWGEQQHPRTSRSRLASSDVRQTNF